MPCPRLELRQQDITPGEVFKKLFHACLAVSLVIHLVAYSIVLCFSSVKSLNKGLITALKGRLVDGNTCIFADGILNHLGNDIELLLKFRPFFFQCFGGKEQILDG